MARPKNEEETKIIPIRFKMSEYEKIKEQAEKEHLPVSTFIKSVVIKSLKRKK